MREVSVVRDVDVVYDVEVVRIMDVERNREVRVFVAVVEQVPVEWVAVIMFVDVKEQVHRPESVPDVDDGMELEDVKVGYEGEVVDDRQELKDGVVVLVESFQEIVDGQR